MKPENRERKKVEVLEELRRISIEGIAPSAYYHKKLNSKCTRYFGSWINACKEAGVIPISKVKGKREIYPELIEFIAALTIVSKHTKLNDESIGVCMNQVKNQHIKVKVV